MRKLLLVCTVFMAMFVTGETLTCQTCRVGFVGKCMFGSTETCSDSEPNCFRGNLAFNVSSLVMLQTQGCLNSTLCNRTEVGTLLTVGYTVTKTCCSTDLCNGASSIQLPLSAALVAALMVVWSNCLL
ncbi:neurotoxin 3FTx-LK [Pleuronectes platessa]|uniref:neurotoxin 3FTx-LK n=1 Tax=Pleuronectes platessa TaxID=8262 RepID=UPI00232A5565|nr:neurotoxin 3FTx-LK [Pleuronectes platessa]